MSPGLHRIQRTYVNQWQRPGNGKRNILGKLEDYSRYNLPKRRRPFGKNREKSPKERSDEYDKYRPNLQVSYALHDVYLTRRPRLSVGFTPQGSSA